MAKPSHNLDTNQIQKACYDPVLEAMKVSLLPTELAIELSADDGDSVISRKEMLVQSVLSDEVIDISKFSRISVLSEDLNLTIDLKVVLNENIEIAIGSIQLAAIRDVCYPKIKLIFSSSLNVPVYLIAQT